MRGLVLFFMSLCLIATPLRAWSVDDAFFDEEPPKKEQDWEASLIDDNRAISEWFDGMAEGLDLFLTGKKYTKRKNETRVIVETGLFASEKEPFSDASSFNLNLRLPNFEEYWNLTFSSYDETREHSVTQTNLRQSAREKDYGARLGFFKKLGNVRAAFQPRVSFAGRFKISHSMTFESVAESRTGFRLNPKMQFYADADQGVGIFGAFNFNFPLNRNRRVGITFINEGDYKDRMHLFSVTNGLVIAQKVSSTKLMQYGVYFNSVNEPNYQLAEYILQLNWSHMLYKNMLGYELVPYLNFNRTYSFAGYYGGSVYLRLYF
jgi:hypothetical protein